MIINYEKLAAVLTASGATGIDEFNLQHAVALAEDAPKVTGNAVTFGLHVHTGKMSDAKIKVEEHNSRITRNPSILEWAKGGLPAHEIVIAILSGTREDVTKFAEAVDIDPAAYSRATLEEFASATLLHWAYFQRP